MDTAAPPTSTSPNSSQCLTPWLAAIVFPLQTWAMNIGDSPGFLDVSSTFLIGLSIAAIGVAATWIILRNYQRSSLIATVFVVFVFAYGHSHILLYPFGLRHRYLFPVWCALLVLLGWVLASRASLKSIATLSRFSAVAIGTLVLVQVGALLSQLSTKSISPSDTGHAQQHGQTLPDIYFLVVDAYARSDMLSRYAKFDNQWIESELKSRGFKIRDSARSNYSQTMLSVPSTLSMDYLEPNRVALNVNDNEVLKWLRPHGYRYRFVGSTYPPFSQASAADYDLRVELFPSNYVVSFISTTVVGAISKSFVDKLHSIAARKHARAIELQLQQIGERPPVAEPIFTFAHIMLPHSPFMFGPRGPLPDAEVIGPAHAVRFSEKELAAYVGQIEFLNARLVQIVDLIDSQPAAVQPIIVIQADHGGGMLGLPREPSPDQIEERLSIFSAVRAPESIQASLYETITPVNQFRVIVGHTLNVPLEILPDRSRYSAYEDPWRFFELQD